MGEISRAALFGKLNSVAYKAIEAATVFCKLRGNPYVELAHWFHQLLQLQDSDLHRIIRQFNIEPARLARDLTEALDRLPRGSTSITDLSSHVEEAVERGWVYGSLMFGESQVRTGYLVLGILPVTSLSWDFFVRFIPFMVVNQLLFLVVGRGIPTWRGQQYSLAFDVGACGVAPVLMRDPPSRGARATARPPPRAP